MNTELPTYRVTISREDNLWVAVVADLPGGATDVEHFADLQTEVRDLIGVLTDADTGDFWVEWHYRQGRYEYTNDLRYWQEVEGQAAESLAERDNARQAAIRSMRAASLSLRDIADVMGLSHQRVAQLAAGSGRQAS